MRRQNDWMLLLKVLAMHSSAHRDPARWLWLALEERTAYAMYRNSAKLDTTGRGQLAYVVVASAITTTHTLPNKLLLLPVHYLPVSTMTIFLPLMLIPGAHIGRLLVVRLRASAECYYCSLSALIYNQGTSSVRAMHSTDVGHVPRPGTTTINADERTIHMLGGMCHDILSVVTLLP